VTSAIRHVQADKQIKLLYTFNLYNGYKEYFMKY